MPLSPPVFRTLQHTRRVVYRGYERADGLWDIEGELLDTKPHATASLTGGPCLPADAAIHSMAIRATVNLALVVQAIEVSMNAFPLGECPRARASMQSMVGCTMSRGWRKSIEANLGGVASCTHLRELLNNMATAAFQTVSKAMSQTWPADRVPPYVGQCTGWDWDGEGVRVHHPQFFGRSDLGKVAKPAARPLANEAGRSD